MLLFIDHFSRYVPEGRYYLHEDFAALRFGFRRLLLAHGCFDRLYIDNGPSFQTVRFHAACSHESLGIEVVHSKPYVSEGRGVCERFNRTVKEQFESEIRNRDDLLTLDELNAYFEAWLSERYHTDKHSETGEAPTDRFIGTKPRLRNPPELSLIEELLRLRYQRKVHKKWSTVVVDNVRYVVDPALRGRRVWALHDPFDPAYVLIEYDRRVVQRALPQKPGEQAPQPPQIEAANGAKTDYLALLRLDYEKKTRAELSALKLRPPKAQPELELVELISLVESCRGCLLSDEAHLLPDDSLEDLRLLTADNLDQGSPFSLILVGQPLLRERLCEPIHYALWQRIGVKLRLRPLADHEVGPFIEGHIKAAGAKRKNIFDQEAVAEIFHHSRGIPRLVQNIALDSMLVAMEAGAKTVDSQAVGQAIIEMEVD